MYGYVLQITGIPRSMLGNELDADWLATAKVDVLRKFGQPALNASKASRR